MDDILLVAYGKCSQCGKLTPPVSIVDYDFETAIHRMVQLASGRKWHVTVKGGDTLSIQCPKCGEETLANAIGEEPPTVTMVTEFD